MVSKYWHKVSNFEGSKFIATTDPPSSTTTCLAICFIDQEGWKKKMTSAGVEQYQIHNLTSVSIFD